MAAASQHTFWLLTERAVRARSFARTLDWPPSVWRSVSVEERRLLHRPEDLRQTPAQVRMLVSEPLLGPLAALSTPRGASAPSGRSPQASAGPLVRSADRVGVSVEGGQRREEGGLSRVVGVLAEGVAVGDLQTAHSLSMYSSAVVHSSCSSGVGVRCCSQASRNTVHSLASNGRPGACSCSLWKRRTARARSSRRGRRLPLSGSTSTGPASV